MHDAEVEVEFVLRRFAAIEPQGNGPVELVLELRKLPDEVGEEGRVCEGLHRIEGRQDTQPRKSPSREIGPYPPGFDRHRRSEERRVGKECRSRGSPWQ